MTTSAASVLQLTHLLQEGTDPFWAILRKQLAEHLIDPSESLLALSFEDDVNYEFGVLVIPDGGVIQFGYRYRNDVNDGSFAEWADLSESWQRSPYSEPVKVALEILSRGGQQD